MSIISINDCLVTMIRHCPVHVIAIKDFEKCPFSWNEKLIATLEKSGLYFGRVSENNCVIGETSSVEFLQRKGRFSRTLDYIGLFKPIEDATDFSKPGLWLMPIDRRPELCRLTSTFMVGETVFCVVNGMGKVKSVRDGVTWIEFSSPYNFKDESIQMPNPATYRYVSGMNEYLFGAGFTLYPSNMTAEFNTRIPMLSI